MPTVSELRTVYTSEGSDKMKSDLATVAIGQEKVATSASTMNQAQSATVAVTDRVRKSVLDLSTTVDRYLNRLDAATKLETSRQRTLDLLNREIAANGAETDRATRLNALAAQQQNALQKAMEGSEKSHRSHADAANLNRMQSLELMHVSKSLFDQLAAGASPMRALSLEGGRIAEIFSGGVGPVLGSVTSRIAGLLTPTHIATAGLVGLGAAAVAAFSSYESAQNKIYAALQGRGRGSGFTPESFDTAAASASTTANVGLTQSRSTLAELVGTGRLGTELAPQVDASSKLFSKASGLGMDDAGKELAKAFADPAKGVDLLNEKVGGFDDRTRHPYRNASAARQYSRCAKSSVRRIAIVHQRCQHSNGHVHRWSKQGKDRARRVVELFW